MFWTGAARLRGGAAYPRGTAEMSRISARMCGVPRPLLAVRAASSAPRQPPPSSRPPPNAQSAPETILFHERAVPQSQRRSPMYVAARRLGVIALVLAGAGYVSWRTAHADSGEVRGPPAPGGAADGEQTSTWSSLEVLYQDLKQGVTDSQAGQRAQFMLLALKRSTTIIKAVALCMWDYRRTLNARYSSKEEEDESLRQCHLRSSQRLLRALQANGGLYIKLGQHISSVILLPKEWTNTMRPLQDQNEPTPLEEIETLFRSETGQTFEEAFSYLDPKPLGVASLAQVHRARDRRTGQLLAVKMLHPDVERFSAVDMQMVTILVHWVKRVFPEFSFEWLADEMNRNLPLELDFRHEASNARRAERDFAQYKYTCACFPQVPWVHKRVMAMEFIEGCRPDDLGYLAAHNIDRNRVSQELSRIVSQMLYLHGFFHADPHGGNVFIRPRSKNSRSRENFEIVLLDHGLYFEIDEELRANYARFWLSLLSPGTPRVQRERRKYARLVGNISDELYPILESAVTGRSGLRGSDPENPLGVKNRSRPSSLLDMDTGAQMGEEEQDHIRNTVMQKEGIFLDILELLRHVPRAMLMVLKINDLTRSIDRNLHTTHGHTRPFLITARYCALAARRNDKRKLAARWREQGFSLALCSDWLHSWAMYIYFNDGLMLLEKFSDLAARVRKCCVYTSTLFFSGLSFERAHRAAAGIDEQERTEQREEEERMQAIRALESEDAEVLAAAQHQK